MNYLKTLLLFHILLVVTLMSIENEAVASPKKCFIENRGQWPNKIAFASKGNNLNLVINEEGIFYDFRNNEKGEVIKVEFANSLKYSISGLSMLPGKYNFFLNNSPENWFRNISLYKSLKLSNVYPGIDVVIRYDGAYPRYDFIILPGANPNNIKMKVSSARSLSLIENEVIINGFRGKYRHSRLFAYQEYSGKKHKINCEFKLDNNEITFITGRYNKNYPLIIDPIVFADYIGGSDEDRINAVKTQDGGYIVTAGSSSSFDFKTTEGVYDTLNRGGNDIIIKKFRVQHSERELIFATFIGGGMDEMANDLDIDLEGDIYITGQTKSDDFPIIKAFGTQFSGNYDAFFIRLSSDGTDLLNSSYLGGNREDIGTGIAINPQNGSVALCGYTNSRNFPIYGSADQGTIGGLYDAFITKLRPSHTSIDFSTYWGGTNNDRAWAIDQDNSFLYIGGETDGNFPIKPHRIWMGKLVDQPIDAIYNGGYDGFAIKMDANGSGVEFSTYFGGKSDDRVTAVAYFDDGSMLIAGETQKEIGERTFMITDNAYQKQNKGGVDGFIAHLGKIKIKQPFNQKYQDLLFSTFFGGTGNDSLRDMVFINDFDAIFVTGNTRSSNFPTKGDNVDSKNKGGYDAYISKFHSQGSDLLWSTLFGGSEEDISMSCDADSMYNIVIGGITESDDIIPDNLNFQGEYAGGVTDGFIAKFIIGSLDITYPIANDMVCAGSNLDIKYDTKEFPTAEFFTIDYSLSPDSAWQNITNEASNGQYRWDIPIFKQPYDSVRIRITHKSGLCDTSGYFKILTPAHILGQTYYPESRELCEGDTILIYTQLEGSQLSFQWYLNGQELPGQTSQDLFISNATMQNNGKYKLVVSGLCKPNATSDEIEFKVNPATRITKQPDDVTANKGDNVQFEVESNGINLSYEWQRNGQKILGANDRKYVIESVQKTNEGEYRCIVTGDCSIDTSNVAVLTVNDPSAVDDEIVNNSLILSIISSSDSWIRFSVRNDKSSFVEIKIHDLFGRTVKTVYNGYIPEKKEFLISYDDLNSGFYWLSANNGTNSVHQKIIITK